MSSNNKNLSREEKEEFADQQMNRMRELNEKIMRRHQEVNQDRMDFERENPSAKLPSKKDWPSEEKRGRYSEKRIEREWDAGKTSELSDRGSDEKERYTRSSKGGGYYDDKRNRRDANLEKYDGNSYRRSSNSRLRSKDSRLDPHNKNTSWRSSGQNIYKSNNSFNRDFKNWNNAPRKQQFSATVDNDKVWRNEELNEARNKQSRVENWVQSISTENWSDEYSNSKKQSNSGTKTEKYGKKYEEPAHKIPNKSFNRRQNQEKIHKSSTSDSSYKEDRKPRYDRYQTENFTSNARGSDQRNYSREKFKKDRSPEYRYIAGTSAITTNQRDHVSRNNYSRENKKFISNKASGNWADKSDMGTKTAWGGAVADKERSTTAKTTGEGGTWSDQEDDYEISDITTKNIAPNWDHCASDSAKWENPESVVPQNRKNNSWNNLKSTGKTGDHKANKGSEQTSSGVWSQDSGRKPVRNQNRNLKKSDEKAMPWQTDTNHINHRLLQLAYGKDYKYGDYQNKEKEIEVIDLCSNSDNECESKNMHTCPESVNVKKYEEMSDVEICEIHTENCNTQEIEVQECSTSAISVKQDDYMKNFEQVNVQQYEVQHPLKCVPSQKSDDGEPCISLEVAEDDYLAIENFVEETTLNDSIEHTRCVVENSVLLPIGVNDLSVSLLSNKQESDLTQCSLNEIEKLKNSSFIDTLDVSSIPCGEEDLKEAIPIQEVSMEDMQCIDGHSKHLNKFEKEKSPDTLLKSITNDKNKKIQQLNSSANAEVLTEIGSFSKQVELEPKCPRHSENSFELKTNTGALIDDEDNDWSTVTDENESDSAGESN